MRVEGGHAQAAFDRLLEDRGEHGMALPPHLAWEPDAQRHDFQTAPPSAFVVRILASR